LEPLYPESMRTIEYQQKNLNTQLSSYAILKYESVLYIKPPVPMMCGCNVPRGYVEPKVLFWRKFLQHVTHLHETLAPIKSNSSKSDNSKLLSFLKTFAATLETLLNISIKELNRECLNDEEANWLRKVVEGKIGGSGFGSQTGWYYDLFFQCKTFKKHNVLSDIMTDYPDPVLRSQGGILHAGIYGLDFLCIAIDGVGVSEQLDTPGKDLSFMQRRYSNSEYSRQFEGRFGATKQVVPLPSHSSTAKRVKGFEDQPMPIRDDGTFSSEEISALSQINRPEAPKGLFVGPVFRYYEFVTSISHRVTKRDWVKGFHSQVSRPEWLTCVNE